jgi:hypothetical protein
MDIKYAAGFFDGEGCVVIGKNHQVAIVVTQANKNVLEQMQALWGGFLYETKPTKIGGVCWHWRISRKHQTERFIKDIIEHSIVKRRKLELALGMLSLLNPNEKRPQLPNGRYAPIDKAPREAIYQEFKKAING